MKRFVFKALAIAIASVASCVFYIASAAVEEYDMKVSSFNSVEVGNDFALTVKKGAKPSVKVILDPQFKSYVQTPVKEGVLSVYLEEKKLTLDQKKLLRAKGEDKPSFSVVITVPAGELNSIRLKDNSSLEALENVVNAALFSLNVDDNALSKEVSISSGSVELGFARKAEAILNVKADKLVVNAAGNIIVDIKQEVTEADVNLNGNANLTLDSKADTMTITAKTTSKATLKGSADFVYYNVSGTANVDALALTCEDANVVMNSICTLKEAASKSLVISISGGANLTYANSPAITITGIKLSTVQQYQEPESK